MDILTYLTLKNKITRTLGENFIVIKIHSKPDYLLVSKTKSTFCYIKNVLYNNRVRFKYECYETWFDMNLEEVFKSSYNVFIGNNRIEIYDENGTREVSYLCPILSNIYDLEYLYDHELKGSNMNCEYVRLPSESCEDNVSSNVSNDVKCNSQDTVKVDDKENPNPCSNTDEHKEPTKNLIEIFKENEKYIKVAISVIDEFNKICNSTSNTSSDSSACPSLASFFSYIQ